MQILTMQDGVSYLGLFLISNIIVTSMAYGAIIDLNHVKFIENNDARLIATSNYNYAMMSPKLLTRNWRTVSVNGDEVLIITTTNEAIPETRADLSEEERVFVENLRDEIGAGSAQGYGQVSSMSSSSSSPGGSMMMTSNSASGTSSSYSSSSSSVQESTSNGMSINMRDDNNFSVSKSDLPFNWSTVFMNGDLVTFVYRDGKVEMRTRASLETDRLAAVDQLKQEMKNMQRSQEQQIASTMQNSMDMVSNVFTNMMGRFPRPPSYKSAVGNMFGDNFPFGPNNSPFSAGSGWPFGGGAFAFANRR